MSSSHLLSQIQTQLQKRESAYSYSEHSSLGPSLHTTTYAPPSRTSFPYSSHPGAAAPARARADVLRVHVSRQRDPSHARTRARAQRVPSRNPATRLNCRSSPPPQMPTAPLHVLPRGPRHLPRLHVSPLPPAGHPPLSRRPFVPHLALRLCGPFAQKILLDSTPTRALADPSLLLHPPLCCLLPLTHPCPC